MTKTKLFDIVGIAAGLLMGFQTNAQNDSRHQPLQDEFSYEARLDSVVRPGFYKIPLPAALLGYCKKDLSDIRIAGGDTGRTFVPYVLHADQPQTTVTDFKELAMLPPSTVPDTNHEIRLVNNESSAIHALLFVIRNVADARTYTLSGSDDNRKWFLIKEHFELRPQEGINTPDFTQEVSFPTSNYRYFRIIPDNKTALSLNIQRVGISSAHIRNGIYQTIPAPVMTRIDSSNHHTYLHLSYPQWFFVDRLDLGIKSPQLYSRQALIYDEHDPQPTECRIDTGHHRFLLPSLKTNHLVIDIDNRDNPPLDIGAITTEELQRYLVTWLEPGVAYRMLAGDSLAQAPSYDLGFFVDGGTTGIVASIEPGEIHAIKKMPTAPIVAASDHTGLYLWGTITLVLIALIVLSAKMLKAVDRKHERK